ncbi:MAG TPA: hypothetical protein VG817_10865 [Gemmatimonadales bacterium]|nr:hypothetical protein [Gemmatimonadales bacterium]
MFIELTDHLRCPAEHDESFLVLIPDATRGRAVSAGLLGCPVCHREFRITDGVADFGAPSVETPGPPDPGLAEALAVFLGLEGPGGYLGLIGQAAALAPQLSEQFAGVHLAAVNAPAGTEAGPSISLLRSPRVPFKSRSLRGLVLSAPFAVDEQWSREAIAAVLPGLRIVGQGAAPPGLELLGEAVGWWVGIHR